MKDLRVCQHKSLQTDRKLDITRANLECSIYGLQNDQQKTNHVLNFEVLELGWEPKLLYNPRILPGCKPAVQNV